MTPYATRLNRRRAVNGLDYRPTVSFDALTMIVAPGLVTKLNAAGGGGEGRSQTEAEADG